MKTKLLSLLALGFVMAMGTSHAATILVARGLGNPGITVTGATGNALSAGGYYIAVGTFTTEPVITSQLASLVSAVAAFQVFDEEVAATSGATQGLIAGSFTPATAPNNATFATKAIYILVGNGATKETSTQFAIVKFNPGAAFPADAVSAGTTTVTTSNGAALIALANAGSLTGNSLNLVSIIAVPEPSTALLGAVAALGLLRRRR